MTRYDPEKLHRHSIRLMGYDYSRAGVYAVTICTHNRECLFGEIVNDKMVVNEYGRIVAADWERTAVTRKGIRLDAWVVMPNHFHGIVVFRDHMGAIRELPLPMNLRQRRQMALPKLIGRFKMITSKRINFIRNAPGSKLWQRNYYEHIIRNTKELDRARAYIHFNPSRWETDMENPRRKDTGV